ncbi:MAG: MBOAT family protein, partial [Myxococcales bacterium]|nr:MBOAT family protein [Myxococcales bacterium]
MVFASLVFLYVFLPLNLLTYYGLRRESHRNLALIAASLIFYAWGEPVWVSLLILSSALDYVHALIIERWRGSGWAKAALASSIVTNLGLLGAFKYSGFLARGLNDAFGLGLSVPEFALPIGISFYTFQALSYVADVYRGEVAAQRSYLKFLLFLSLYHQLVAGPIVRYVHIAREIAERRHTLADFSGGITRFCVGLFKKVCIANVAGQLVMRTMEVDPGGLSVAEGWFGLLMFSLQIYYDFSGYSDMAIGLGMLFGFHYHENFNYPYVARSAAEFWRRWHISLGSFFRDYLYIPLGGRRRRPIRNLLIVWGLTGLWHGASWNFVLWGLYFGVLIA